MFRLKEVLLGIVIIPKSYDGDCHEDSVEGKKNLKTAELKENVYIEYILYMDVKASNILLLILLRAARIRTTLTVTQLYMGKVLR